jgi:hypothetical protein
MTQPPSLVTKLTKSKPSDEYTAWLMNQLKIELIRSFLRSFLFLLIVFFFLLSFYILSTISLAVGHCYILLSLIILYNDAL